MNQPASGRTRSRLIGTLLAGAVLLVGVGVACGTDQERGSCGGLPVDGSEAAVIPDGAKRIFVRIDVPDPSDETRAAIGRDIKPALLEQLESSDLVILVGVASAGDEDVSVPIECMENETYDLKEIASDGTEGLARLTSALVSRIGEAAQHVEMASVGDVRGSLRQVAATLDGASDQPGIDRGDPNVVLLWSSFLTQGTDCLELGQIENPSQQLAAKIIQDCRDAGLLPRLRNADMVILGPGYGQADPDVSRFAFSLASQMCSAVARTCVLR